MLTRIKQFIDGALDITRSALESRNLLGVMQKFFQVFSIDVVFEISQ